MKWAIEGADAKTGQDATITVDAPDAAGAERLARYSGLYVAAVRPVRWLQAAERGERASAAAPSPRQSVRTVLSYQAPATHARLYLPGTIAGVTILGGTLAGIGLMAMNHIRLGRRAAAFATILIGLVITACLVALAIAAPISGIGVPISIAQAFILKFIARSMFGAQLQEQARLGGRQPSAWEGFGLTIAGLAVTLAVAVGVIFVARV